MDEKKGWAKGRGGGGWGGGLQVSAGYQDGGVTSRSTQYCHTLLLVVTSRRGPRFAIYMRGRAKGRGR